MTKTIQALRRAILLGHQIIPVDLIKYIQDRLGQEDLEDLNKDTPDKVHLTLDKVHLIQVKAPHILDRVLQALEAFQAHPDLQARLILDKVEVDRHLLDLDKITPESPVLGLVFQDSQTTIQGPTTTVTIQLFPVLLMLIIQSYHIFPRHPSVVKHSRTLDITPMLNPVVKCSTFVLTTGPMIFYVLMELSFLSKISFVFGGISLIVNPLQAYTK